MVIEVIVADKLQAENQIGPIGCRYAADADRLQLQVDNHIG